ncbi:MAG: transposase [Deltaproteobacteria bacterium]|nr:transposase [Deltaproteobacteria bacterium]
MIGIFLTLATITSWLVDLTIMPTTAGFRVPWVPCALFQRWPFCWWIVVFIDHFSRSVVGHAVFLKEPTAAEVLRALDGVVRRAGRAPKYIITDSGAQIRHEYVAWCKGLGVKPRFGAIGQYGSIAVVERAIKTLKEEGLRRIAVPLRQTEMVGEVEAFVGWTNVNRPHMSLVGATPSEVHRRARPARDGPRFEPRPRYPVPRGEKLRAAKGAVFRLTLGHHEGRPHLPATRSAHATISCGTTGRIPGKVCGITTTTVPGSSRRSRHRRSVKADWLQAASNIQGARAWAKTVAFIPSPGGGSAPDASPRRGAPAVAGHRRNAATTAAGPVGMVACLT